MAAFVTAKDNEMWPCDCVGNTGCHADKMLLSEASMPMKIALAASAHSLAHIHISNMIPGTCVLSPKRPVWLLVYMGN